MSTFLRYVAFSWGFPLIIAISEFAATKTNLITFYFYSFGRNHACVYKKNSFSYIWFISLDHVLPWSFLLYVVVVFFATGIQIRKKLKASKNIAQTSKVVKGRKNFVILLKLLTTTGLTWVPFMFLANYIEFDYYATLVLYPLTLLTGVYIAIAFVFTRKNYQLLIKKFLAKKACKRSSAN